MSSEKWFDWDTEKAPESASEPSAAPAPPTPATIETELAPELSSAPAPEPVLPVPEPSETPPPPVSTAPPVAAERPFTLWIEGNFTDEDRSKLLELLEREKFGIREVDLEYQWDAGRVLLPQISEYAAMRVVQVLRESSLEVRLSQGQAPSPEEQAATPRFASESAFRAPSHHPADSIPISSTDSLEGWERWEAIDTFLLTGLLKEPEWKAEQTDAFARLVEGLKRELRHRAHIKKAEALIRFKAEVLSSPWAHDAECRVQVSALAVKRP
jgi:hypothetical protein